MKNKSAIERQIEKLAKKNITVKLVDRTTIDKVIKEKTTSGIFTIPTGEIWIDETLSENEMKIALAMETSRFWTGNYKNTHKIGSKK